MAIQSDSEVGLQSFKADAIQLLPVIIEKGDEGYSEYTTDPSGVSAVGAARGQIERGIIEAVRDRPAGASLRCNALAATLPRPCEVSYCLPGGGHAGGA